MTGPEEITTPISRNEQRVRLLSYTIPGHMESGVRLPSDSLVTAEVYPLNEDDEWILMDPGPWETLPSPRRMGDKRWNLPETGRLQALGINRSSHPQTTFEFLRITPLPEPKGRKSGFELVEGVIKLHIQNAGTHEKLASITIDKISSTKFSPDVKTLRTGDREIKHPTDPAFYCSSLEDHSWVATVPPAASFPDWSLIRFHTGEGIKDFVDMAYLNAFVRPDLTRGRIYYFGQRAHAVIEETISGRCYLDESTSQPTRFCIQPPN